jgi:hypothetical protein
MRPPMKLRFAHLLLAAGILILPLACQNGGIYWTLQNEVEIDDLSLPNEITVFDVTKIGLAGGSYYAAAGKIWTADDSTVTWNKDVRVVGPTTDAMCNALVTSPFGSQDTLFGGFIDPEANLGLYESGANPTTAGTTWTHLPGTGTKLESAQVTLLKSVEHPTQGLAAAVAKKTWNVTKAVWEFLYWIVTADNSLAVSDLSMTRNAGEDLKTINDICYSTRLGIWFATEGTKLYAGAGSLVADAVIPSDGVLRGVIDDGDRIYVASETGAVFWADEGSYPFTTWHRIDAPTVSGVNPPLTRFAGPVTVAGIGDYLLVGSEGYGYYRLPVSPAIGSLTRCPDTTDNLHTAYVLKMYSDGTSTPKRIFACTSNDGLWRGDEDLVDPVDPDIKYDWVQE